MSQRFELEEFCEVLVLALKAIQRANEIPSYMSTKAREINAFNVNKLLNEKINDTSVLMDLMHTNSRSKVTSSDNEIKSKAALLQFIEETKPLLDRIKHNNFKLMAERLIAAHNLAKNLSEIVEEITENESLKEVSPGSLS